MVEIVNKIIVLGGGSAGFIAAMALKVKLPHVKVLVIRSKDIGIIGVGEGSTFVLTRFLHHYINVGQKKFFETAKPTWKLGLRFLKWGPRPFFHYTFGPGIDQKLDTLPKTIAYYCQEQMEYYDILSAMMTHDRVFPRGKDGKPQFHNYFAYHFENENFVNFLEGYCAAAGVEILDDTVLEVKQNDAGISALTLKSGRSELADLYVDSSGFRSELLGKTLAEPFIAFDKTLFCDRAVVGGWTRGDEPIKPYTTCETMNAGWSWQIEHETRINRGYVYSSAFIGDEQAEQEFRAHNPKVSTTRVVRFVSGRYERAWVKNVVAIGNACGFVEPLEATALGVIATQSELLAGSLMDADREIRPSHIRAYNQALSGIWDSIRAFLGVHYKFNTRLNTPFWAHCREKTDLAGAEAVVDFHRENGPTSLWSKPMLGHYEQFGMGGYLAMLVGQSVPFDKPFVASDREKSQWREHCGRNKATAMTAIGIREALAAMRSK